MNDCFECDAAGIFRCRAFGQFDWQRHAFGSRLAAPAGVVTLRQIHSALVFNAHGLRDRKQEGDALVTSDIGLCVGIKTADCVPILLLDARQRAVAAVHAGWRGSAAHILDRVTETMAADFGSEPRDIWAAIGPCIRVCCYEVGADVWQQFHPSDKAAGKRKLDLAAANIQQLQAVGVPVGQIFDSGLCTFCRSDLFYSFRREPGEPGRLLSAITRLA